MIFKLIPSHGTITFRTHITIPEMPHYLVKPPSLNDSTLDKFPPPTLTGSSLKS